MTVRPLCVMPHQVLRTVAAPVPRVTDAIRDLARDMLQTMRAHQGVGLAAPQIGCSLQLFVARTEDGIQPDLVVLNPHLEARSGRAGIVEGCLSLPDVWEEIPRAAAVRVRGHDLAGRPLTFDANGLLAIIIQHELDHLQGRLIIDRARQAAAHAFPDP